MIKKDNHPVIDDYLASVVRQVRARELHKDIRQEIADHLEELVSLKRGEGSNEEEATRWAVSQMGEPSTVGAELNKVHKPRIPWGLIGWVAVLLLISFVAMYAVELSYAEGKRVQSSIPFLLLKLMFSGIGLAVMLALQFFDYRRMLRYSWMIFIGTAVISVGVVLFGRQINGMKAYIVFGPYFSLDWMTTSIYLFIIAAAGLLYSMDSRQRSRWKQHLLLLIVPSFLYMLGPSISSLLLYVCSYMILLYSATKSWRVLLPPVMMLLAAFSSIFSISRYALDRLSAFWNPYADPNGAGYTYVQINQSIRSAGWWGHGLGVSNVRLPEIHTDNLFTYLVYSLGWLTGMGIVVCAVLFAVQMLHVIANVRDRYGKMITSGLAAMLALQFTWNLGMSLGLLPILGGISLPFLSYGGSHLLAEMAAMGIMFSVYRRKDMIRSRI
ncbi:FtsW/RodA/SpoVE family cell cycle protein [Paenibacillus sp. UNC451MF]|uniref:FtsW/RodA/SpoVE family cell cycle protein n=1 Tax=Paenibacillus sp. UNC451MF TaxID=1449063 RepID=UPI00048F4DB1|nr:FtsW/RodA/SpoVE family cell cycle protein [Paenibacillus sp. UNC451MF]